MNPAYLKEFPEGIHYVIAKTYGYNEKTKGNDLDCDEDYDEIVLARNQPPEHLKSVISNFNFYPVRLMN